MASWFVSNSGSDSNAGTSQLLAYATIGKALSSAASGDTINIQTGTYTQTATLVITQATLSMIGYQTTPGDMGTPPLITTATSSTDLMSTSSNNGYQSWNNISFSNTSGTSANGLKQLSTHGTGQWWVFNNCKFSGFTAAINSDNSGAHYDVGFIQALNCEFTGCVGAGSNFYTIIGATTLMEIKGCYFHGNTGGQLVYFNGPSGVVADTIFYNNTCTSTIINSSGANGICTVIGCSFVDNATSSCKCISVSGGGSGTSFSLINNIFYGNYAAINGVATGVSSQASGLCSRNNAFGSNANANANYYGGTGDVTLTANPFTSVTTGDFSLNSTAGGGLACKGAAFNNAIAGTISAGHFDIGAVQSGGGSSGGGSFTFIA